jgi:hypothetical protein
MFVEFFDEYAVETLQASSNDYISESVYQDVFDVMYEIPIHPLLLVLPAEAPIPEICRPYRALSFIIHAIAPIPTICKVQWSITAQIIIPPILFCGQCAKEFRSVLGYDKHLLTHECKQNFRCTICRIDYADRLQLQDHQFVVHRVNKRRAIYKCEDCGEAFTRKDSLKIHRRRFHNKVDPQILNLCVDCKRQYPSHKALSSHICKVKNADCTETIQQARPYKCSLCPKSYPTKTGLQSHLITHNDIKLFICHCGADFHFKSTLQSHQLVHKMERAFNLSVRDTIPANWIS